MRRKNPFIYYGGKLAGFAVSVFVLSLAVFYIARLAPGDPLVSYYGDRAEKMTAEERAQAEERLGLDEPVRRKARCVHPSSSSFSAASRPPP